jgi:hypothetical protein
MTSASKLYKTFGGSRKLPKYKCAYQSAVLLQSSGQDEEVLPILHKIEWEELEANTMSQNFELEYTVKEIDLLVKLYTKLGRNKVRKIATTKISWLKILGSGTELLADCRLLWFDSMIFAMFACHARGSSC